MFDGRDEWFKTQPPKKKIKLELRKKKKELRRRKKTGTKNKNKTGTGTEEKVTWTEKKTKLELYNTVQIYQSASGIYRQFYVIPSNNIDLLFVENFLIVFLILWAFCFTWNFPATQAIEVPSGLTYNK